jgi:hypothetical protein
MVEERAQTVRRSELTMPAHRYSPALARAAAGSCSQALAEAFAFARGLTNREV